jgi:hypothetical protein
MWKNLLQKRKEMRKMQAIPDSSRQEGLVLLSNQRRLWRDSNVWLQISRGRGLSQTRLFRSYALFELHQERRQNAISVQNENRL